MSTSKTLVRMVLDAHDLDENHPEYDHQDPYLENHQVDEALTHSFLESPVDDVKPWKQVLTSTLFVNLATLIVILLVASGKRLKFRDGRSTMWKSPLIVRSIGAGALMVTSVLKVIPESLRLLEEDPTGEVVADHHKDGLGADEPSEGVLKFVVAIMAGFLLSFLLGVMSSQLHTPGEHCQTCEDSEANPTRSSAVRKVLDQADGDIECCETCKACAAKEDRSTATTASVATLDEDDVFDVDDLIDRPAEKTRDDKAAAVNKNTILESNELVGRTEVDEEKDNDPEQDARLSTIGSILTAGAIHNFIHGIFVGNAFLCCDSSLGYFVVAATLYHELSQSSAQFRLFTNHCGLGIGMALLFNFLSGFWIMAGASTLLCLDVSGEINGIILAISAGVNLLKVGCDSLPRDQEYQANEFAQNRLIFILCFAAGSVPIGLALIHHENHDCI